MALPPTLSEQLLLTSVALSANAGISVTFARQRIWIDALHKAPARPDGYSHVTPQMWEQMQKDSAFADPDLICFTHCHDDHYSEELALRALSRFTKAGLILPCPLSQVDRFPRTMVLSGRHVTAQVGDVSISFVRLPHEGAQYSNVAMYGMLLRAHGRSILVGSDCETASPLLADVLRNEWKESPIDLAILPFPYLTLRKGRAFLEQHIRPAHLLLYHIPFAEDDVNGYREAAFRALDDFIRKHGEGHMDVRLLANPMQTELLLL